ncbi:class I SAM-dependent methyltransferase [Phaeodactylibacter luteus]|uniref:Class I SAM-dependent methyltransferase n=1 Tax=Phaeodactylibacter luteus TaxID=1564516 RepID=A0A5C6RNK8_9BACT|nr:class I SAM-dependent methyltransferase [Phaeodactylibacter luteus]TXB63797.1 class I SAM-dependent methyltransferase [Phaeodactylibacter luteus]
MNVNCRVCSGKTNVTFQKKVLGKYLVNYAKCEKCGLIQTETPFWLDEAYSSAITSLDIGLISRNLHYQTVVSRIIENTFNSRGKFLDYGGGYGMFVRMMRDRGFNYYRQDIHCDNLFAKYFDIEDLSKSDRQFELVTAFEVMEHLVDPVDELNKILSYGKNVLFSTELQPENNIEGWWYIASETGQHIAFYTEKALKILADRFGLNFYTNGRTLHLFTEKEFDTNPLEMQQAKSGLFIRGLRKIRRMIYSEITNPRPSLLSIDFEMVKQKVQQDLSQGQ